MAVAVISRAAAVGRVAHSLRLPAGLGSNAGSIVFVAQALRRALHILSPCAAHELERAVRQSLLGLVSDGIDIAKITAEALEQLIAYGEVLEMRPFNDDPWGTNRLVLRPAPPSFVLRTDGTAIILGVAGDEITPLPEEMNERLCYHGVFRVLAPRQSEDLRALLRDSELLELSEKAWLHLPTVESAGSYGAAWAQRLAAAQLDPTIEGLQVLDTRKSPSYYTGRWVDPRAAPNGMAIGRRGQKYGAPLWCLVDIVAGAPVRFLDLMPSHGRERPCDLAWRIQMALDAGARTPQRVHLRSTDSDPILDFFSPLPSWAERKLAVTGERVMPERCLFSYRIPTGQIGPVTKFLSEYLWITSES